MNAIEQGYNQNLDGLCFEDIRVHQGRIIPEDAEVYSTLLYGTTVEKLFELYKRYFMNSMENDYTFTCC